MKTIKLLSLLLLTNTLVIAQEMEWIKTFGGTEHDVPSKIITDDYGNIYTAGYFYSNNADFDPGAGIYELSTNGSQDIYIQKLNSSGEFLWAVSFGGLDSEFFTNMVLDENQDIYITGVFRGTVDFDPGNSVYNITSNTLSDGFVLKLNSNGEFLWATNIGSSADSIQIDNSNNVLIIGFFKGEVDFDPGAGIYNLTSLGGGDTYILKLSSDGEFIWVKNIGGDQENDWSGPYNTTIDNSNNIYITGGFLGNIDFDPGNDNLFLSSEPLDKWNWYLLKLNNDGELVWAESFNTGGSFSNSIRDIKIDSFGNLYLTGRFSEIVDFDPGLDTYNITTAEDSRDFYLLKLNNNGELIWVFSLYSYAPSFNYSEGWSITLDNMGNPILTGKFRNTQDFNPGVDVNELISNGDKDIFIAKYDTDGNYIWANSMGGELRDVGTSIYMDNLGSLFLSGTFRDVADLDPSQETSFFQSNGKADVFVMKLIDNTLNITDQNNNPSIVLYPNPTTNNITIALGKTYQKIEVSITNSLGQQLLTTIKTNKDKIEVKLNASPGLYYCNIVLDEKIKTTLKVIKN